MKTISRDGKQRRPRKGDPVFFLDKRGRRVAVPALSKIALEYEWSRFSNRRMQFHFIWRGKKHDVFDSYISLEMRQREMMVFNAAVAFCQDVLNMDNTVSSLRESSVVKTIYRRWRGQIEAWAPVLDEAAGMLAMGQVMET